MNPQDRWPSRAHTLHQVVQVDLRRVALQTLLSGLVFSVLLAIPVAVYHRGEARNLQGLRLAEQERVIQLAEQVIHQEMDAVLSDLRYLSQHNELKAYLENTNPEHRRNLALEYLVVAKQKRVYDQIRFIGLNGREEVRIDHAGGKPVIREEPDLQDKHDRYYFQEAQWLSPGQIYVSPFDLNVERGVIEQPIKPTIRFVVPVADAYGLIRGVVALNYQGQRLIDKLGALAGGANSIWLLNAEGHWLIGPSRQVEWGFMPAYAPMPAPAQDRFASFRRRAMAETSGAHGLQDAWIRFERIYPLSGGHRPADATDFAQPASAERYSWTLAVALASPTPQTPHTLLPQELWTTYAVLSLFAFFAAGALAFAIHRNKALAQSMEKVIDSLPILISYVDAEQRYRYNNQAYEKLFHLSPRQIHGKTVRELLGDTTYQEVRGHIEQTLAGAKSVFESQLSCAGPEMHDMVVTLLPDLSAQGEVRGFFVVADDVSLIKQSERRERQRMLELAHVSRLASMSEMAAEIAHEINQPLAAISMYSAAGLRTLHTDCDCTRMQKWLEAIHTQARRASETVRRMRGFMQTDEPQHGPVDLNRIASEVAALLRHEGRAQGTEIALHLDPGLPTVQGEAILLEQVVFNLVRNAMDALLLQPGERRITLVTSFDAEQVYVEVGDTGLGIDPVLGERVFDLFVTTKRKGAGMGLAISRSIIEAHSGAIRQSARTEGGAAFLFSLPWEAS
ncbi:MAG: PAS domain-containing protein [Betaproteobacteria bacterium]|nr:PAS domain-containing protein [Betaproteobacteria bacterium]